MRLFSNSKNSKCRVFNSCFNNCSDNTAENCNKINGCEWVDNKGYCT